MNKMVRDGKVAVLYSPGYGAGWYSWHGIEELLYDSVVVEMVNNSAHYSEIEKYCEEKYGDDAYYGGAQDLKVMWLDRGESFVIREYDGSESVECMSKIKWNVA